MKLSIIKANEITPFGKGYLVGVDGHYIIDASMLNFNNKKVAVKFVNRIIDKIKKGDIKNILDIFNESNCFDYVSRNKNEILENIKNIYWDLLRSKEVNPVSSDKDLLIEVDKNINKFTDICELETFLYYNK